MASLGELANKLQEYILKQQESAGGNAQYALSKYSSVKIKMDSNIRYAHIIVEIGISKAIFNVETGIKTDGGLGPFDRYVLKWMANSWILYDIRELYKKLNEMILAKHELNNPNAVIYQEGEAEEIKPEAPINPNARVHSEYGVKNYLRGYLSSSRRFR
jgi:hypothetical protein